jgi:hypothetical protein
VTVVACRHGSTALELHDFDGKQLSLVSPVAYAPGQRLETQVALTPPFSLPLKSLGSVRRADGRFNVRARAMTMRKEERALLLEKFPASSGP